MSCSKKKKKNKQQEQAISEKEMRPSIQSSSLLELNTLCARESIAERHCGQRSSFSSSFSFFFSFFCPSSQPLRGPSRPVRPPS
jgi:hypothetical protein